MVEKFNDSSTKNARIKIDYSGVKPKVQFSYPDKKNQQSGNMSEVIIIIGMIIGLILFGIYNLNYGNNSSTEYSPTKLEAFTKCAIENQNLMDNNYSYIRNNLCKNKIDTPIMMLKNYSFNKDGIIFLILVFIIPILIYFIFKKEWDSLYPKWAALTSVKKYRKFIPKDVEKDNKGNWFCEIPIFSNIILNYNAKKDFSKYLKFFEIREYNFKYYKLRHIKNSKKKKRRLNEIIWYAKFYFNQKPKTGELEIVFR